MSKILIHIHSGPDLKNKATLGMLVAITAYKNQNDVNKNENKSADSPERQKIASNSNPDLSPEDRSKQQKLEQWLRKIPDDPGRLLRNKMKREYQRRDNKQNKSKQYW